METWILTSQNEGSDNQSKDEPKFIFTPSQHMGHKHSRQPITESIKLSITMMDLWQTHQQQSVKEAAQQANRLESCWRPLQAGMCMSEEENELDNMAAVLSICMT